MIRTDADAAPEWLRSVTAREQGREVTSAPRTGTVDRTEQLRGYTINDWIDLDPIPAS